MNILLSVAGFAFAVGSFITGDTNYLVCSIICSIYVIHVTTS